MAHVMYVNGGDYGILKVAYTDADKEKVTQNLSNYLSGTITDEELDDVLSERKALYADASGVRVETNEDWKQDISSAEELTAQLITFKNVLKEHANSAREEDAIELNKELDTLEGIIYAGNLSSETYPQDNIFVFMKNKGLTYYHYWLLP